jgi:hypothetical protein
MAIAGQQADRSEPDGVWALVGTGRTAKKNLAWLLGGLTIITAGRK